MISLMATVEQLQSDQIQFPKLGIDLTVSSEAFSIGGMQVTWYGILITVGMLLAMVYGFSRMQKQYGIDPDRAIDAVIGGVLGGVIGARAYYVIFRWEEFAGDWKSMFNIRSGGLAIYGGIIGALLVGSIVCKIRKVRLLPMFDIASLGFLIGQGIGRWGNFTNQEAFGDNTDSLFGMTGGKIQAWIAANYSDGSVDPYLPVHPCFLYESIWCLTGFVILHFVAKRWRKFDGQIFLMYMVWYGMGRFWIEGLRTDSLYQGTIKISQLVALLSVAVGIILLCVSFSRIKRMGSDYVLYVNSKESAALIAETAAKEEAWQKRRAEKKSKKQTIASEEETTHVILDASEVTEHTEETESETHAEESSASEEE